MRGIMVFVFSILLTLLLTSCNLTTETYPPPEYLKFTGSEKCSEDYYQIPGK